MPDTVIQCKPAHINMSAPGFIGYATHFLQAYDAYEPDKAFSPVKYYLVCHSLELSLKAYLAVKGVSARELKGSFGHNLHKIVRKCLELGILEVVTITKDEKIQLERANAWYKRKGFEYFDIQNIAPSKAPLPDLCKLKELAEKLIKELQPVCLASAQK